MLLCCPRRTADQSARQNYNPQNNATKQQTTTTVRDALEAHEQLHELLEVVMDLGRPPLARFPGGDARLSEAPVTADDLAQACAKVGDFGGDNRAGIDATLHRISAMRNRAGRVVGLTCRVGRAVTGSAELVRDLIVSGSSILFLGRPGVGKTTAIRELSRLCADELGRRVVIVDTSNEIGGDGDVPHAGIGRARRMQVPDPEQQHRVMIEAVENRERAAVCRCCCRRQREGREGADCTVCFRSSFFSVWPLCTNQRETDTTSTTA